MKPPWTYTCERLYALRRDYHQSRLGTNDARHVIGGGSAFLVARLWGGAVAGAYPGRGPENASATLGRAADATSFLRAEGHDGRLRLLIRTELSTVLAKPELLAHAPVLEGITTELAEARDDYAPSSDARAFSRRWGIVIQEEALRALQVKISSEGHADAWSHLKPYLSRQVSAETPSSGGNQVTVEKVEQLRERYRLEVRRQVAETVTTPLTLDSELAELFGPG